MSFPNRHLRTGFVVAALALGMSAAQSACIGDEPLENQAPVDVDAATAPNDASDGSETNRDASPSDVPDASADGSAPGEDAGEDAAPVDAGEDDASVDVDADAALVDAGADAAPPTVTCVNQGIGGAFFFTKNAAKAAMTPGGTIQTGSYVHRRWWDGTGGQISGSALVFETAGALFIQQYTKQPDPAPAVYTTKWIQVGTNGAITLTEMCRAGEIGVVQSGTYEVRTGATDTDLYIDLGGNLQYMLRKN